MGSGSRGRAELVSPSTCCSLVSLWKELIVTHLRDVMLSYILTSWSFKNIFSSFLPVRPRRSWGKSSLSLKSHKRRRNFAVEVVQFSSTYRFVKKFPCVQYTKKCMFCSMHLLFSATIRFLLTSAAWPRLHAGVCVSSHQKHSLSRSTVYHRALPHSHRGAVPSPVDLTCLWTPSCSKLFSWSY